MGRSCIWGLVPGTVNIGLHELDTIWDKQPRLFGFGRIYYALQVARRHEHVCSQGDTIRIVFTQTAVHYGRFELRLCPLSDPSQQTEYKELSEACLDAHQLYLAPNSIQACIQRRVPVPICSVSRRKPYQW